MNTIETRNAALSARMEAIMHDGFLSVQSVKALALHDTTRLQPILARFQTGRLVAPAQDVLLIWNDLGKAGWDLRDFSVPSDSTLPLPSQI